MEFMEAEICQYFKDIKQRDTVLMLLPQLSLKIFAPKYIKVDTHFDQGMKELYCTVKVIVLTNVKCTGNYISIQFYKWNNVIVLTTSGTLAHSVHQIHRS